MTYAILLLLLLTANAAPVLAYDLLSARAAWPVDLGQRLPDGRRLLGDSCTYRGWVASLVATPVAAWVLGTPMTLGLKIAAFAMIGDALSSFVKRRLGRAPGTMVLGLDQLPESLLPLLAVREAFGLAWLDLILLPALFLLAELALSRLAYYLGLRNRPY
jgi:hypothetical protein